VGGDSGLSLFVRILSRVSGGGETSCVMIHSLQLGVKSMDWCGADGERTCRCGDHSRRRGDIYCLITMRQQGTWKLRYLPCFKRCISISPILPLFPLQSMRRLDTRFGPRNDRHSCRLWSRKGQVQPAGCLLDNKVSKRTASQR